MYMRNVLKCIELYFESINFGNFVLTLFQPLKPDSLQRTFEDVGIRIIPKTDIFIRKEIGRGGFGSVQLGKVGKGNFARNSNIHTRKHAYCINFISDGTENDKCGGFTVDLIDIIDSM